MWVSYGQNLPTRTLSIPKISETFANGVLAQYHQFKHQVDVTARAKLEEKSVLKVVESWLADNLSEFSKLPLSELQIPNA